MGPRDAGSLGRVLGRRKKNLSGSKKKNGL